jgi:hypothetical protein
MRTSFLSPTTLFTRVAAAALVASFFHVACCTSTSSGGGGLGGFGGQSTSFSLELSNDGAAPTALCLPNPVSETDAGAATCVVIEGSKASSCSCDPTTGRAQVPVSQQPLVQAAQATPGGAGLDCFCEVLQLCAAGTSGCTEAPGADLPSCQSVEPAPVANGWCYVDATKGAAQAAIVSRCPPSEQQELRFLGSATPQAGATFFVTCQGF